MIRYAFTIFLSALLLFQVQPMIAKFILPWFGGTSSVWTTCMLFFQVILLLGYCYSHLVTRRLTHKQQWMLHAGLLCVALIFLPIQPDDVWKPDGTEDPTWQMLLLLTATIGFPFFLLSTTGPLIQAWQSRTHSNKSAYRLFAVSNFGSLLGLLGYPFLVEPYFRLGQQSLYWSIGFGTFAAMCLWSGWQLFSAKVGGDDQEPQKIEADVPLAGDHTEPTFINCIAWTLLAFAASAMLLATTNQMCQEVASVPFLWVLPLSLYLITFIICFENPRWYRRAIFFPLMFVSVFIAIGLLKEGASVPLPLQVSGYALVMFACCMTCHGELAHAKPAEKDLTLFYLMVSVGGALGGIFVVIIAPKVFTSYYEFHVSLVLSIGLSVVAFLTYRNRPTAGKSTRGVMSHVFAWGTVPVSILAMGLMATQAIEENNELHESAVIYRARNSYGTLHVRRYFNDDDQETSRSLVNGRIKHGSQSAYPAIAGVATSYYSPISGVGAAIRCLREIRGQENDRVGQPGLRIGVVGLGTGTMAAWGQSNDSILFYEINPAVEEVAREHFTYIKDSRAKQLEVVIGDARIQMERHLKNEGSEKFDLLVIDAFSSDAIPMHLLTRECFKLYCDNLSERGVLAVHVSNRYLELETIVYNLSVELNYTPFLIFNDDDDDISADASTWALVVRDQELIDHLEAGDNLEEWDSPMPKTVWTDDFGSLTEVMDMANTTDFASEKLEELADYLSSRGAEEEDDSEEDDSEEDDSEEDDSED